MKTYNKLVRDRIPEIIEKNGGSCVTRQLSGDEYKHALLEKLVEEAQEVRDTRGERSELEKELGDVLEVVDALVHAFELNRGDIEKTKADRKNFRGGFTKKLLLESIS